MKTMRRWFLILLLAILPVQYGWASMAQYAGHELTSKGFVPTQIAIEHSATDFVSGAPAQSDGCVPGDAHCHASVMVTVLASPMFGVQLGNNIYPPCAEVIAFGQASPEIERPKWSWFR